MISWKKKKNKPANEDSRIKWLMRAIFVIGLLAIAKLYYLQIYKHDHYAATARRQQEVKAKLEPVRGRIFLSDNRSGSKEELYPLATNKQFALIYAIPAQITEPEAIAEAVYGLYDAARVEMSVDFRLETDPAYASSAPEFKKLKRELDIKEKKAQRIAEYLEIFNKKGDPYEPLIRKADDELAKKIIDLNLKGIAIDYQTDRFYPEGNIGSHLLGFVGYVGDEKKGRYGLEGYFNTILTGQAGSILADRVPKGVIIMDSANYQKAEDGSDLFLTINRSIQFEVCNRLKESVRRHGADSGTVIIEDPKTGAIIAMCSYPDYDPNNYQLAPNSKVYRNQAIYDDYEPGSTFKAITMASALNEGKVTPETTYEDKATVMIEGWPKPIKNSDYDTHGAHGITTMTQVLENSLNTGAIWSMERLGAQKFADYVRNFGFGVKAGIELDTESSGNIYNIAVKKIRPINAATASFGQGITATPLQMVNAYAVLANGGLLMRPYIVDKLVDSQGNQQKTEPQIVRRVISERTASLVSGMLVSVVEGGHAKRAQIPGYYIAGKTGTAQVSSGGGGGYGENYIHSFIGYPANNPQFVMLIKIDHPRSARFAESTAVPLFGELAPFLISHFGMQMERDAAEQLKNK